MSRMIRQAGVVVTILVILAASAPQVHAQFPLAQSSTLTSFDGYHDYSAAIAFMDFYAEKYPNIVEKFTIGDSYLGTPVRGLIITNKATGPHADKSAYWADGNRHAGEVTGGEAVLYTIKYLCENYGKDPVVTAIVDQKVAYLIPKMNPDGSDVYFHTPGTLRSTVHPYDQDGDGVADEDPAEDLDGDGYSRQMRWKDPEGRYVLDASAPNGMRPRQASDRGPFYSMGSEGIDNDGDGRINEDGIGGLDLHRNFPYNWRPMPQDDATGRGWTQGGAGAYPLSEPEVRNIFIWLMAHPNINTVETYDTTVPMLLRPPSMGDDTLMHPEDLAWYQLYDEEGGRITGYERRGNVYRDYGGGRPLFGHSPDFGYFGYGVIWYGDELWNGGRGVDFDGDGEITAAERERFQDSLPAPYADQPWTPAKHPTLGDVEVGGSNGKFIRQNPPPAYLEAEIKKNVLWAVRKMEWMPLARVSTTSVQKVAGKDGLYRVDATFVNEGRLPTALEQAKEIHIVQEDMAELSLPAGLTVVNADGSPRPSRGFGGRGGRGGGFGGGMMGEETQGPRPSTDRVSLGWLEGSMDTSAKPVRQVTWYVKADAGAPRTFEVAILSTRGGVHRMKVDLPR